MNIIRIFPFCNLLGFLILHRRCLISYGMYYNRN
nr:MAG TPA: hypothetical protein [Caudoviricetes sp.]DAX96165.1 MAG TPA: hypothetical protein [Bacteriophage sp.]